MQYIILAHTYKALNIIETGAHKNNNWRIHRQKQISRKSLVKCSNIQWKWHNTQREIETKIEMLEQSNGARCYTQSTRKDRAAEQRKNQPHLP